MKKYLFFVGLLLLLVVVVACTPMKKDSAGKVLGDPTGRVLNTQLSCVGYCSGYATSSDEWCFCDAPCKENGNCCQDFETACPNVASKGNTE